MAFAHRGSHTLGPCLDRNFFLNIIKHLPVDEGSQVSIYASVLAEGPLCHLRQLDQARAVPVCVCAPHVCVRVCTHVCMRVCVCIVANVNSFPLDAALPSPTARLNQAADSSAAEGNGAGGTSQGGFQVSLYHAVVFEHSLREVGP